MSLTDSFLRNMANSASETATSTYNSATESMKGTADQASKEGNKRTSLLPLHSSSPAFLLTLENRRCKGLRR